VCDVIDNSIDAEATNIEIWLDVQPDCDWIEDDEKGFLMFIDDGKGIENSKLKNIIEFNAERSENYQPHELGSFGLGLKDALLAHGQEITVISKQKSETPAMVRLSMQLSRERDDWTYVDNEELTQLRLDWDNGEHYLSKWNTPLFKMGIEKINTMESGTIVLLEFTHRPLEVQLEEDNDDDLARISIVASLKEWIAMTFADYLSGIDIGGRTTDKPLQIRLNGDNILPLDPFMKEEIGKGHFNGQQGTLTASYEFEYSGLECKFNQYILPNSAEREIRCSGHDDRMKRATKQQIVNLQGIYIKRNGRILDGPWNGMWRREGMGMSTSHHTVARWELVLPPKSIEFSELVPPDKSRVSLLEMLSDIRRANRVKRRWHSEDAEQYSGGNHDDLQFNQRARARQNSRDLISVCNQDGCNTRTNDGEYCVPHTVNRCQLCNEILEQGTICNNCASSICAKDNCTNTSIADSEFCIICSQSECVVEGCNYLQQVTGNYCVTHVSQICNYPGGCESMSIEGVSRCQEHMELDFEGVNIIISTEGPLFEIGDGSLILNINHGEFSKYLQFIQNVR